MISQDFFMGSLILIVFLKLPNDQGLNRAKVLKDGFETIGVKDMNFILGLV
jgi:hypothetical protein